MELTQKKPINWQRGFHRIFAVLWILWSAFVMVGIPLQESNQRSNFAALHYSIDINNPTDDKRMLEKREQEQRELWARASLVNIYKTEVIPNMHWFIMGIIIPPLFIYGLIRAGICLALWLVRGFRTP